MKKQGICRGKNDLNRFWWTLIVLPILLFMVLNMNLGSSQLIFQKDSDINISVPCSFNQSQCSDSATCNYSVFDPEQERVKNETFLSISENSFFNIILNKTQTSEFGNYFVTMFCLDQGSFFTSTFEFGVTPSGGNLSTSQGIIYLVILLISGGLLLLTGFGALKIPWKNVRNDQGMIIGINQMKFVKLFLLFMTYIIAIWFSFMLKTVTFHFLTLNTAERFMNYISSILLAFFFPVFLISIFITIIVLLDDKKITKKLKRGLRVFK